MTRFKYYSNYLACLLGTLIAFELCWIGAKYVSRARWSTPASTTSSPCADRFTSPVTP